MTTTPSPEALAATEYADAKYDRGSPSWCAAFDAVLWANRRPTPTDSGEVAQGELDKFSEDEVALLGAAAEMDTLWARWAGALRTATGFEGLEQAADATDAILEKLPALTRQIAAVLNARVDHRLAFSRPEPVGDEANGLVTVAQRNLRHFVKAATFKCETDREASLNCLDVLENEIGGLNDLVAVLRSYARAETALASTSASPVGDEALVERVAMAQAYARRSPHDQSTDAEHFWSCTSEEGREIERKSARAAIQAIPAPATDTGQSADGGRGKDTDLLSRCYIAMRDAMSVIDADEGPGLKHSKILNALAQARVDIEHRSAALPKPAGAGDET